MRFDRSRSSLVVRVARALGVGVIAAAAVAQGFVDAAGAQSGRGGARRDTIVRMAGRPVHAGVARLVEELSIGVTDGAQEYMFGAMGDMALGPDSSIYVFDTSVPVLRHYDANGKFVRTIGRQGQGPGEYSSSAVVEVAPDGRIVVMTTGRINLYSPAGQPIAHWPTPPGGAPPFDNSDTQPMIDSAGYLVYAATLRDSTLPLNSMEGRTPVVIRRRLDGTIADTIHRPALPEVPALTARGRRPILGPDGQVAGYATSPRLGVPFNASPIWIWSPLGYLVTSVPTRYSLELLVPGGSIVSIRRDVPAVIVSDAERRLERERVETYMRLTQPNWSWGAVDIPRTKPVFSQIFIGSDGRIWVSLGDSPTAPPPTRPAPQPGAPRERVPPGARRRAQLYDVFEPDGRYLGQVETPSQTVVRIRRGDFVWATSYDADDVAFVKRYRIAWR